MVNTIGKISGATSNIDDNGIKHFDKKIKDVNNIDEILKNARDLGLTSINNNKLTCVSQLSKYDNVDIFKFTTQSNGKMTLAIMDGEDDGNGPLNLDAHYKAIGLEPPKIESSGPKKESAGPLDLSDYDKMLDELLKMNDPLAYAKKTAEKNTEEFEESLYTNAHPSLNIQVIQIKAGKEVIIADSNAEIGSDELVTYNKMMNGEYEAERGEEFYIKVTRADGIKDGEEIPYSMEASQGKKSTRNFLATETPSDDTKNSKESILPSSITAGMSLDNTLTSAAMAAEGAANILLSGAINYQRLALKE